MAKIKTYNDATTPLSSGDKVIGTEATDDSTKNFTVGDIASFTLNPANGNVVNSVTGSSDVSATPTTGDVSVGLTDTTVVAGQYDYATVNVDSKGRITQASTGTPVTAINTLDGSIAVVAGSGTSVITNAATNTITINSTGSGGSGSVTQVSAGTGLETSPVGGIITTGTVSLEALPAPLVPGPYTNANVTVDQYGRVTDVSNGDGQPDQDLQSVLDTGNSAVNQSISLTGVGAGISTSGAVVSGTVDWTAQGTGYNLELTNELDLSCNVLDANGASGTYQQILIANPALNGGIGGVEWVDQPVLSVRVQIPASALIGVTSVSGLQLIPSQGLGNSIQVLGAAFSYTFGTTAYAFTDDLGIYTGTASLGTNPQYTIPASVINAPSSQFNNMNVSANGELNPNQPLELYATAGANTDPAADGTVNIEITYKVVSV